jgi:hypothetical protein
MARRTGAAVAAADIDAIQRADDPQNVEQNGKVRDIDLDEAAKEIKKAGASVNTLNPLQKPKKDDASELKNGAPVPLPKLGQ